jgi:Arc/MetJ-type ribon-helix-helix transcriptional regulator
MDQAELQVGDVAGRLVSMCYRSDLRLAGSGRSGTLTGEEQTYMTIHLPDDVERDILAEVHSGQFASVDEALAKAWRAFQQHRQPTAPDPGTGLIGALRDDAELLDQAVEHAMTVREDRPWRLAAGE